MVPPMSRHFCINRSARTRRASAASPWHKVCSGVTTRELRGTLSLAMRGMPLHIDGSKEHTMAIHNETRSRPKDAIAMLQADHRTVRQLFRAYRTAQAPATQWEIAQHIFDELDVHAQLEEVVFYQAV